MRWEAMRLARYGSITLAAAVALTASIAPAAAVSQPRPAPGARASGRVNGFSPSGPWNKPLPAKVPIAPNSKAIVGNIIKDVKNNIGSWALNTDMYSSPIFTVGPNTPTQNWTYTHCLNQGMSKIIAPSLKNVPTPKNLISSLGTDASATIYQPSTDTYWDFWRAHKDTSGHWSACWGGRINNYSTNPGIFRHPLGASASGLPLGAFVIRISELQHGRIDHAVNLIPVRTQANCHSWPANRDDGNTAGANIPCEGQRFRLDPSFNVSKLYSPVARMVAKAMQVYGAIVTDKGGAVVTYAQDPRPYEASHHGTNPYPHLLDPKNRYPGFAQYVVLNEIPLNLLEALPLNYGEPTAASH